MAITKIKPIRGTVNKALTYILDPQKTDDAFYVSSYGCAASDAAAKEFEWTRNLAVQQGMQMPKVLARHLIQSFDIGEVTPEEAHEVGKQLADEWLKGKYEYVIATHIDKGHCHNHIIFNAVNYVDFHAYRSNKRTYRELRQLSDEICKEHGLSVIPPSQNKGTGYKEYTEAKRGTSWKQKLKQTIDRLVITAKDYDDFLRLMQEAGYYAPDDYDQGMLAGLESNIKDDRTDLDLLFGCLIDWGLPLSLPYKSEQIDGCTVHTYNDGDLIACFDANIPESVVKEIAKRKPLRAVFRDSGFASSPEKINVFEIFKLYMPEDAGDITKRVRVI